MSVLHVNVTCAHLCESARSACAAAQHARQPSFVGLEARRRLQRLIIACEPSGFRASLPHCCLLAEAVRPFAIK